MNKFLMQKYAASEPDLGPRGRRELERLSKILEETSPKITRKGLGFEVTPSSDPEAYEEATLDTLGMVSDVASEQLADKRGLLAAIDERGAGYGLSAGAGGLLGALLMKGGLKKRLIAALLGASLGAGANYLRRKSYYGDAVKW